MGKRKTRPAAEPFYSRQRGWLPVVTGSFGGFLAMKTGPIATSVSW